MSANSRRVYLFSLDLLLFFISFWVIYTFRVRPIHFMEIVQVPILLGALITSCFYYLFGAYSYLSLKFGGRELIQSFLGVLIAGVLFASFIYLFRGDSSGIFGRGVLIGGFTIFFVLTSAYRWIYLKLMKSSVQQRHYFVICENKYYSLFKQDLEKSEQREKYTFALVDKEEALEQSDKNIVGGLDALGKVFKSKDKVTALVIGLNSNHVQTIEEELMKYRMSGVPIYSLSDFYEYIWEKIPVYTLSRTWFVFTSGFRLLKSSFRFRLKRLLDILLSVLVLVLTFPIQLLVGLLVYITSAGPILFRQKRSGEFGVPFEIIKFRTMKLHEEKNGPTWTVAGDSRITFVGRFLRKTRLDELPQVINVLRGEMSFIGPRPERPEFDQSLSQEIPFYELRYQVKPGITGWAQVCYPYGASVEDAKEKLQYDLFYIKNYSFYMDVLIFIKTIRIVLGGKGR